ncbi:hypothetical protein HYC85_022799 [Camellia sinensis]|uniref:UBR-type domain-containing protein n=1 Tax=Camellia sinensis TaxID=4442 RepID=A0A7J7GCT1_CAMSI|nr:hypothetical protein HYC85_022799 [Camellia sinensis]
MADVFEEEAEAEPTVSIHEYLKDVEDQELEADLVLGGDEGKECTYTKGYMKRQAIFSCLTCTPDGNAGVCTACSLSCHDGHEIVELWTKRNFRCDCGNSKFGEFFCKLFPNKDVENVENSYNHNFKGSYCTCGRPYPDPEAEEQVEMIQCCICEDWFHEEHIGLESSDEVCSAVCSFLTLYPQTIWAAIRQHETTKVTPTNATKDKGVLEDAPTPCGSSEKLDNRISSSESPKVNCPVTVASSETVSVGKDLLVGENSDKSTDSNQCIQGAGPSTQCVVRVDLVVSPPLVEKSKPMFLSKNWRDVLCRCEKCGNFYTQKGIGFLLDKEDSIAEYEKMAKEKRDEKLQQQEGVELNFLNKLGHVEKMEILNGIADMKNEIHSFLGKAFRSFSSNAIR